MLRDFFPYSNIGARIYGGSFVNEFCFVKSFDFGNDLNELIPNVNSFLLENGYKAIDIGEVNKEGYEYSSHPVYLSPHPYLPEFVLSIHREPFSKSQTDYIINELKKFRDERDWKQFHNPKDLAIALSIESNELLELFLWKNYEDANKEKIKEELADVLSYALLIAEKYDINVEEIILEKIQKNKEKYPIAKAKGIAKKYDEL